MCLQEASTDEKVLRMICPCFFVLSGISWLQQDHPPFLTLCKMDGMRRAMRAKQKYFQDQSVFRSGANSQGLSWWHPWSKSARADRSLWQWTGQSFRPYRSSEKRVASRNNMSERSSLGSSPPWCEWRWFAHAPKTRGLSAKVTAWFRNGSHSHLRASERLLAKAGGWTCEGPLQWTLPHLDRIWCPWWSFSSRR